MVASLPYSSITMHSVLYFIPLPPSQQHPRIFYTVTTSPLYRVIMESCRHSGDKFRQWMESIPNLYYDHSPTSHVRWRTMLLFPAYECRCIFNATSTIWWSIAALASTITITILDDAHRHSLVDPDGDGEPGSPHFGMHVPWGFEIVHWTYIFIALYFFLRLILSFSHVCYQRVDPSASAIADMDISEPHISRLARLAWIAHSLAMTPSVVALIIYVTFMQANDQVSQLTTASYALNAAVMLFDIVFWNMSVVFGHVIWVLTMGWVYVLITLVHYMMFTTAKDPYPYVYSALNWSNPLLSLLNCIVMSGLVIIMQRFFSAWTYFKSRWTGQIVYQLSEPSLQPITFMGLKGGHDGASITTNDTSSFMEDSNPTNGV